MDNSFRLSAADHERIYAKVIEPTSFLDAAPTESARAIIIAAQPGAGKSVVAERSMMEFANGNVVGVSTDELRAFHPNFDEIVALDDKRSAERTHEDASAWSRRLAGRCIETHRNIILEGVFKDAHKLSDIITSLRKAGYAVTVRVVAAHERYSIWGIHLRYESEKDVRGHGRYVPLDYHDECYAKLPDSVELVETQRGADRVEVYDRKGNCLYENVLEEGNWKFPAGARATIEKERARALRDEERVQYRASWGRIVDYMKKRRASRDEHDALMILMQRITEA